MTTATSCNLIYCRSIPDCKKHNIQKTEVPIYALLDGTDGKYFAYPHAYCPKCEPNFLKSKKEDLCKRVELFLNSWHIDNKSKVLDATLTSPHS